MHIHTLHGFAKQILIRESRVITYTDASIHLKKGGVGFVSTNADKEKYSFHARAHEIKDINRLELGAIFAGIAMCDPSVDKLIFTDSQTSITNLVTAGKKTKYDKLSKFVLQLAKERFGNIYITKVKAHSGDPGNNEADYLARMGTTSDVLYVLPDEFETIDSWFQHHKYLRLSNQNIASLK